MIYNLSCSPAHPSSIPRHILPLLAGQDLPSTPHETPTFSSENYILQAAFCKFKMRCAVFVVATATQGGHVAVSWLGIKDRLTLLYQMRQSHLRFSGIDNDIRLYDSDKKILKVRGWLNDKIIQAALQLLKNKHPFISCLESPILQVTDTFGIYGSSHLQCWNRGDNHWITASSIGCGYDAVRVYDSMNLQLSSLLIRVVAGFLHTSNDYVTIEYADMQYQSGGDDCRLFAIASACAKLPIRSF